MSNELEAGEFSHAVKTFMLVMEVSKHDVGGYQLGRGLERRMPRIEIARVCRGWLVIDKSLSTWTPRTCRKRKARLDYTSAPQPRASPALKC